MFEIIKNGLTRKADIKVLKLENTYYKVTIFYYGDYTNDFKQGKCDIENITVACKVKENAFLLDFLGKEVLIDIQSSGYLYLSGGQVNKFKKELDIAHQSAAELQDIMKEYFLIEV